MKINKDKILKRLDENKNDRGKVTLYLSKKLLNDFRAQCDKHSVSLVVEELMKEFISNSKNQRRR